MDFYRMFVLFLLIHSKQESDVSFLIQSVMAIKVGSINATKQCCSGLIK